MAFTENKMKTAPWEWFLAAILAIGQQENLFEPLERGLDPSWRFAVNVAHELGLSWGKDFFFTYGPLGFINYLIPIGSSTVVATGVLLKILIPAASFLYLFNFLGKSIKGKIRLWIVFLFLGVFFLLPDDTDIFLFLLVILISGHLVGPSASTGKKRLYHAVMLGLALAVLSLLKLGSFLLGGLSCFFLMALLLARRDYQVVLWGMISFSTMFFILWNIFSGPASSLPGYIHGSLEISRHFNAEMSMDLYQTGGAFIYLLLFVLFPWIALGYISVKRKWTPLLEFLFLLIPFIFYVWKISAVRSDHMLKFLFMGSVPALMLAALESQICASAVKDGDDEADKFFGYMGPCLAVLGAAYLSIYFSLINLPLSRYSPPVQWVYNLISFPSDISKIADLSSLREKTLADFQKNTSLVPKEMQSTIRAGAQSNTVDIFPWEITDLRLAGLTWKPRPVIQSYSAYSPWLDEKNARHLRENGPDFILFSAWSIDGRYQPSDEPLTLDELRSSYQPVSMKERLLLLRKSPRRDMATTPLSSHTRPWGEWVDVPDGEDVYARIHALRNLPGEVGTFFYRDMGWTMEFKLASGQILSRRVVTANLASGLYLSRFLHATSDFAIFFHSLGDISRLQKIEQFRLTPVYSSYYRRTFEVLFERRGAPVQDISP